ncbi:MAG: phage tail protein [Campylobacteraceae bacterium]|jgi:hypothetical protein|nr:phage tail protein [Campylobacteraceae bacterium]
MSEYKIILTNRGKEKLAAALAGGGMIKPVQMAFGDGNGADVELSPTQTSLFREVYRRDLNSVAINDSMPNDVICEGYIPKDAGDFWIRELGIYDDEGTLIAVGNYPATYKPSLTLGIGTDIKVSAHMEVSNTSSVTLLIDPSSVLASQEWVLNQLSSQKVSIPIGMLSFCASRTLPAGWLRLDGSVYTADMFPALWAKLAAGDFPTTTFAQYENLLAQCKNNFDQSLTTNQGNCGFFGLDTEAKRFRMPTLTDGAALTQALANAQIGKWYNDAIRNITGRFNAIEKWADVAEGAFYYSTGTGRGTSDSDKDNKIYGFDASRVVPTAEENRPRQARYPIIMFAANEFLGDSAAVWNAFLDALNAKAQADLSNVSADVDFVIENWISEDNNLWYRKYKSGLVEQGGLAYVGAWGDKAFTLTLPVPLAAILYCMAVPQNVTRSDTWNNIYGIRVADGVRLAVAARDINYMWWQVKGMGV